MAGLGSQSIFHCRHPLSLFKYLYLYQMAPPIIYSLSNICVLTLYFWTTSVFCNLIKVGYSPISSLILSNESLIKAKMILENNQYPPSFYEPIIKRTLNKIIDSNSEQQDVKKEDQKEAKLILVQYRGRITERFEQSLKRCMAPCKVMYTLRKVKSVLL